LEEAFGVVFDARELGEMTNVRAIVSIIEMKKGMGAGAWAYFDDGSTFTFQVSLRKEKNLEI
jgi:hypothetical protein